MDKKKEQPTDNHKHTHKEKDTKELKQKDILYSAPDQSGTWLLLMTAK